MYTKEIYQTKEGYGFKIFKDNIITTTQETVFTREGIKPISTKEKAESLANEMVEYLTKIDGQ